MRSLVILWFDANGDASGSITVSNESGLEVVLLNEGISSNNGIVFEFTPPTPTVTLQGITPNLIDNMFIVNPPKDKRKGHRRI